MLPPLVLIVDDEHDFRECLSWVLRDGGFRTIDASDGAEAMALVGAGTKPDVIILDMMMPVKDGLETLAELRAAEMTAEVPVIFCTASLLHDEVVPGASAVVRKPFDAAVMLELVQRLCESDPVSAAS